jgi:hypothetical protein
MEQAEQLCLNGINAATGEYLVPPLSLSDAVEAIKAAPPDGGVAGYLRRVWRTISQPHLGLPPDVDAADVRRAGWAVVFHRDEGSDVKDALSPLIEHRRSRTSSPDFVKILEYRSGETRAQWLARYGVGAGSIDPARVPYYLLFVGGPDRIPFTFCHEVDVEYAVGCLHFDSVVGYANYVESVVRYENDLTLENRSGLVYFGTRHPMDRSTQLSADYLVRPLSQNSTIPFATNTLLGVSATKAALRDILTGTGAFGRPAVLFTASHGIGWPAQDQQQTAMQGALLCQDWPAFTPVKPEHCFAGADLPEAGDVHGMITFHFACYGAGTPSQDRFIHRRGQAPPTIANQPFIAALPKALLSHPRGGALACIGHVERAWGYSIATPLAGPQLMPYQNMLHRLALGHPVGHALKDFNERYAALSTALAGMLEQVGFGVYVPDQRLASAWVERNDAEGYLTIGDPAVSLRVA